MARRKTVDVRGLPEKGRSQRDQTAVLGRTPGTQPGVNRKRPHSDKAVEASLDDVVAVFRESVSPFIFRKLSHVCLMLNRDNKSGREMDMYTMIAFHIISVSCSTKPASATQALQANYTSRSQTAPGYFTHNFVGESLNY
jgi:hypothetical protein